MKKWILLILSVIVTIVVQITVMQLTNERKSPALLYKVENRLNKMDPPSNAYLRKRYVNFKGPYTVLTNYVSGTLEFYPEESITFVTHSSIGYLGNVAPLVRYWFGPISIAVYAPGSNFWIILKQISFLRTCTPRHISKEVISRVTFHIFFDTEFIPDAKNMEVGLHLTKLPKVNCSEKFPTINHDDSFSVKWNLMYPINVARNIAKENARTDLVLVCDIELFPNPPDLIPMFLDLIKRRHNPPMSNSDFTKEENREVFVLPTFEVSAKLRIHEIPKSKQDLVKLLTMKLPLAFPFHYYACYLCHRFPNIYTWIHGNYSQVGNENALNIFHSTPYITTAAWEPFYIGSIHDPPFDERLYRENALNKPIQAAILCHMNYTFHILDNAFLVHRPGLRYGKTFKHYKLKLKGREIAENEILPLQFKLYGRSTDSCWQIPKRKLNWTNNISSKVQKVSKTKSRIRI